MQRNEVKSTFSRAEQKIKTLSAELQELSTGFVTNTKYVDKVGYISEIETAKELVKAKALIDSNFENLSSVADELGLAEELQAEETVSTFMGYTKEIWDADVKLRAKMIKINRTISSLKMLKKTCKSHLSSDDKFELDFEKVSAYKNLLD